MNRDPMTDWIPWGDAPKDTPHSLKTIGLGQAEAA